MSKMKLKKITIRNFKSLYDVLTDIGKTSLLTPKPRKPSKTTA